MDVGTFLLMLALAYAFGVLWYDLPPGVLLARVWRVAVSPFLGILLAESVLPPFLPFDPDFGGLHVLTSAVGSIVAMVADWAITRARYPASVSQPELLTA
jgi:hypothetical protein